VWAALPADCRRVRVVGDAELAALLRDAGLEVERDGGTARRGAGHAEPRTTVVALGRPPTEEELAPVLTDVEPRHVIALAFPEDRRRAAEIVGGLRQAGLESSMLAVATRLRRGARGRARRVLTRRPRHTGQTVVVGARRPTRSLLDVVFAEAARVVDMELERRSLTVLSTGSVLAQLVAPSGEHFALRLAGGPAAGLLDRSGDNVAALLASDAPRPLRERLPVRRAGGRVGPVRWTLEDWISGNPPRRLSAGLWSECLEFLVALHRAGQPAHAGNGPGWSLAPDFDALEQHADEPGRRTLARLEAELERRLADVPQGWAHGDFWPANLLADGDHLLAVLDWDSASAYAPAMLDLMHLLLLSDRRARRLPHGSRSLDVLLPLAKRGGDARMRRYCEATATSSSPPTLEGLALAYWVSRVGRDLRTYENRPRRKAWMDANLHQPLAKLAQAGW
jgi:aminoglycoside phosphotransferase (APT) family kinase protein